MEEGKQEGREGGRGGRREADRKEGDRGAQQLEVPGAFAEDPGLVPKAFVKHHRSSLGFYEHCMLRYTHIYKHSYKHIKC